MSRFKRDKKNEVPGINSGSLPDIIFMLLFFFMVTTVMREVTLLVRIKAPEATEAIKMEKKSLVSYIYVGPPPVAKQAVLGTEPRIQLSDAFAEVNQIGEFIEKEKEKLNEADKPLLTTSLKVDAETKMGIVTDIKQELRKANAFKISYSTRKKSQKPQE